MSTQWFNWWNGAACLQKTMSQDLRQQPFIRAQGKSSLNFTKDIAWLVVSTPLKNSQLGWLFPIYGTIKMFQTTNQLWILPKTQAVKSWLETSPISSPKKVTGAIFIRGQIKDIQLGCHTKEMAAQGNRAWVSRDYLVLLDRNPRGSNQRSPNTGETDRCRKKPWRSVVPETF